MVSNWPAGIEWQNGFDATTGLLHGVTNTAHIYARHEERRRTVVTTPSLGSQAVYVQFIVAVIVSQLFQSQLLGNAGHTDMHHQLDMYQPINQLTKLLNYSDDQRIGSATEDKVQLLSITDQHKLAIFPKQMNMLYTNKRIFLQLCSFTPDNLHH